MHLSSIDGMLWAAGYVGQLLLVGVLVSTQRWRSFPIFTAYFAFNLLADPVAFWVLHHATANVYFREYFVANLLDYLLQFLILYEIARNVLRPVKRSVPASSLWILAVTCLVAVPASFWLAPHTSSSGAHVATLFFRLSLGSVFARLLIFAAIAGFSQMLGIGWKNHVLQLTTGLAFYGAVAIIIQLRISQLQHPSTAFDAQYATLTELQTAAYVATLAFWTWAFSQNEAPRKEFTPQMEAVLVTISGTARRTRLAVTRSLGPR